MPRKRQTQSGEKALAVSSVPGRRYGEGVQSQALQSALPAPDRSTPVEAASPTAVVPGAAMSPEQEWAMRLGAAQGIQSPGLLRQDTTRPKEPVTAGLPIGPGAGPEILGNRGMSPTGAFLRRLTEMSGDGRYAELARRSGL